ncbi:MAG: ABC transporter substrate-binding protein [Planctomycetes bacterium]|nr:ABC transporter substrate-binding protein [Planctomycetota bacterium]
MRRRFWPLVVPACSAVVAVVLVAAWHWPRSPSPSSPAAAPAAPATPPARIVSLAPNVTEMLFALGAGDRVVGVTQWCNEPAEAKSRRVVGGMGQPNLEILVELRPDLILAPNYGNPEMYRRLRDLGYRVEHLEPAGFAETLEGIGRLGGWLGVEERAAALIRSIRSDRDALAARLAGRPRVKAVFVVGQEPLFVAGAGTLADSLLAEVGADNACGDARGWVRYGMEEFLERNPDVILDSTHGSELDPEKPLAAFWGRWPDLAAVKSGRLHSVDADLTNRAGPRIVRALELVAEKLHPEAFLPAAAGGARDPARASQPPGPGDARAEAR